MHLTNKHAEIERIIVMEDTLLRTKTVTWELYSIATGPLDHNFSHIRPPM